MKNILQNLGVSSEHSGTSSGLNWSSLGEVKIVSSSLTAKVFILLFIFFWKLNIHLALILNMWLILTLLLGDNSLIIKKKNEENYPFF